MADITMCTPDEKCEIRFLGDLQRLSPQPGDVFVITTEAHICQEQRHAIVAAWASAMPGHKVLVLDGGMKIGVIGEATGQSSYRRTRKELEND